MRGIDTPQIGGYVWVRDKGEHQMNTREKVGIVILWWMLKLVSPFRQNFEIEKIKEDIDAILKENTK